MHKRTKTLSELSSNGFLWSALVCTLAIAVLSLVPGKDLPKINISFFDKIGHFVAYAALSFSWGLFFIFERSIFSTRNAYIVASVSAIIYGAIMEFLQHFLVQSRTFDLYDILANSLGAAIGIGVLKIYYSIVKN
ncbi:VanZ family protein [Sungkyunkwania multivorans]|uniref:VanZ family protein n=1 Tax=Sungkyunkwania multivorans TaxID=1173618 RepID=A0ABW3CVV3_9FLAO